MNSRRIGIILAVLLSAAALSTACSSIRSAHGTPSQASRAVVDLPSNGWNGGPAMEAALSGAFHASVIGDKACAWIGDVETPMLWPAGYRLETNPLQLIGPDGTVVANEGDAMHAGGGGLSEPGPSCGTAGWGTWSVQGEVARGR
jgi:hypothetical protein